MREMTDKDIIDSSAAEQTRATSRTDRNALFPVILGLLTTASILLLVFQANRALELRIEAAEVWSDYQVKIVKATAEEDPNLRQQYTEEQDVLREHAQELKQQSSNARYAVKFSTYAAVLLLIGTAITLLALVAKNKYAGYLGLLMGIIGMGFGLRPLF